MDCAGKQATLRQRRLWTDNVPGGFAECNARILVPDQ